jgi:hypothetical protein
MEDASMTSENVSESETVEPTKASVKAVDDQLIDELVGRAQAEGLQLTGEGGLLQQLRACGHQLGTRTPRPVSSHRPPVRPS